MFQPVMTPQELSDFLDTEFPQMRGRGAGLDVVGIGAGVVQLSLAAGVNHLRPGGAVSGPSLFTLADVAAYLAILTHIGRQAAGTVTINMTINFLKRASPGLIRADARLLRLGRRVATAEVSIFNEGEDEPCAHAVGTYAVAK